jgi:arsenate reductase (thioredoxin)
MNVLFICKSNIGRSQMAEAFFNKMAKGKDKAKSAGVEVQIKGELLGEKARTIVDCMIEEGINLEENKTKALTLKAAKEANLIVIVGDDFIVPDYVFKNKRVILWPIADGKGKDLNYQKSIRSDIKRRVENLVFQLENENLEKKS